MSSEIRHGGFEDVSQEPERPGRRVLRIALWVAFAVAAVVAVWMLVKGLLAGRGTTKQAVQQVVIMRPPPPPPPPPKVEQKPPPPKPKEEVKLDQPQPKPQDTPKQAEAQPDRPLGVDAAGTGGADGFGLVGNQGGRDLVGSGPTIGGGGKGGGIDPFLQYQSQVQQHVAESLSQNKKLRAAGDFKLVLNLWLRADGTVERYQVAGGGRPEIDDLVRIALSEVPPSRRPLPKDLPQPSRIVVTNRF